MTIRVCKSGLRLADGKVLPLYAGAMHYFRHAPEEWGTCLDALVAMGLRAVDTYVPWGVHETAPREYDFGQKHAWLDVAKFVRMAQERGLYVIIRPGPHVNAELTCFGLPERVVWSKDCQAQTPKGNPVMLPMAPLSFPVPSYASDAFHEETAHWFAAVGNVLAPLCYPDGPIVLVQIDNEGAMYFRDGAYDQDYHPDAIRIFRAFLKEKYGNDATLRKVWREDELSLVTVEPPKRFSVRDADDLPRHLDWVEFHEELVAQAMERFAASLEKAGFGRLPTMHNLPIGESVTPLNPARVSRVLDLVALDYYHHATPESHSVILRRTTELVSRAEGAGHVPYGAEVGAGFPPVFSPMDEKDSLYTLMSALAYGLRGFNLYMAVDRDRWIGAPVDRHGVPRPFADKIRVLLGALHALQFHELRRRIPVRLVMPRVLRRLARATHAFGPVTPTIFHVSGAGFATSCLEQDVGLGEVATVVADEFLRAFERALAARGVPYAHAGGEGLAESLVGAEWVICALAGGVKPQFIEQLQSAADSGVRVTVGPRVPTRDGNMRSLQSPLELRGLEFESLEDLASVERRVSQHIEELALPCLGVTPAEAHICVHENDAGIAKAVFVMNPTAKPISARVSVPKVKGLRDALDGSQELLPSLGGFEVLLAPRCVRIFEVLGS